ncbi:MAG: nuclear transport factor 2 family protein [Gallionella sp.]|nr:nuclear transport factor 2 family protein [Gallionella sp.]
MLQTANFEERLARVEDRLAIRELISRYNMSIDDRDLKTVGSLFTEDAFFGSVDGAMGATTPQGIVNQFKDRFSVLGATNHFTHDQVIEFESSTRARGMVASHAEVWRKERAMITALRYADVYEKADGAWRFAERRLSFMYYLNVEDYSTVLGVRNRNLAGDAPKPADWPEGTPTYVEYRPGKG